METTNEKRTHAKRELMVVSNNIHRELQRVLILLREGGLTDKERRVLHGLFREGINDLSYVLETIGQGKENLDTPSVNWGIQIEATKARFEKHCNEALQPDGRIR